MITRRQFLRYSSLAGAGLLAGPRLRVGGALAETSQVQLPGSAIEQFVDPLPLLSVAGGPIETLVAGAEEIALTMREFLSSVLPTGFQAASGEYHGTWTWGYRAGTVSTSPAAGTYIGPAIVATRGVPTQIRFVNELGYGDATRIVAWYQATDQTLHWANPLGEPTHGNTDHYAGPIPTVPHLHGGDVPAQIDGGPDAWFTSDGAYQGHAYHTLAGAAPNETIYRYPNGQEPAPVWFHDHVLGLTRLNVYAGLAGAYLITDPAFELPTGLHPVGLQQGSDGPVDYIVPLVIQDRSFDADGQLFIPNEGDNAEHPYWVPEFDGDTIAVNGKVWPFLDVEPRRYRFAVINGSNARAYELSFVNPITKAKGPTIWQIGTDGGYLDTPVKIDPNATGGLRRLVVLPGERADLIVDFAGFGGQRLILNNIGRHPYPKGTPPNGATIGRIMEVRVGSGVAADHSYDPASGVPLRRPMVRLVDPAAGAVAAGVHIAKTRQLTLNEIMGPNGPLEAVLNNTAWDGFGREDQPPFGVRPDFKAVTVDGVTEYFSELPDEGTTELWEIVNMTADAHPIHTHLTQFQLLNRQAFNVNRYNGAYAAAFPGGTYEPENGPPEDYRPWLNPLSGGKYGGNPSIDPYLQGPKMPPAANEAGWKDTVKMLPGQVTRIVVRYAPVDVPVGASESELQYAFDPGFDHGYVWHCHIIDHEDNEMMRPLQVQAKEDAVRTYLEGVDY